MDARRLCKEEIIFYIRVGLHFRIPLCCIRWFVTGWIHMSSQRKTAYHKLVPVKIEYIPCPVCLASCKWRKRPGRCTKAALEAARRECRVRFGKANLTEFRA